MTTRVELPGDNWAELKHPMEVTERERRPLKQAFIELGERQKGPTPEIGSVVALGELKNPLAPGAGNAASEPSVPIGDQLDIIDDFEHMAMAFFITAWSFPFEPTADALFDIPVPCYNALANATAPYLEEMFPGLKEKDKGALPTTP